jgi:hypothetical protein
MTLITAGTCAMPEARRSRFAILIIASVVFLVLPSQVSITATGGTSDISATPAKLVTGA